VRHDASALWIICLTEFPRPAHVGLAYPPRWTLLFFLAVGLAAG
jgi:hypothetical protein